MKKLASNMMPLAFMLIINIGRSRAWPSGAPDAACRNGIPGHAGIAAKSGPAPYRIDVQENAQTGEYDVTMSVDRTFFKGYFIRAVDTATGNIVGIFTDGKKTLCGPNSQSAATHSSSKAKFNEKRSWMPTSGGRIKFIATFVAEFSNFYTNVESKEIIL